MFINYSRTTVDNGGAEVVRFRVSSELTESFGESLAGDNVRRFEGPMRHSNASAYLAGLQTAALEIRNANSSVEDEAPLSPPVVKIYRVG